MTTPTQKPSTGGAMPRRTGSLIGVLLTLSLGVNLFLGGLLLGQALDRPPPPPPDNRERGLARPFTPEGLTRMLPPEERRAIAREFGQELRENRGLIRERQRARREAMEALGAEPFDAEVARAAAEEVARLDAELRAVSREAFFAAWDRLTPEQRAELRARWQERGPRRGLGSDE